MTPGAVWLRLQMRFQHGLKAAWNRDVVRKRILDTPPVDTRDTACEIHVLTSDSDWLNLIWALKSFYLASDRHYELSIHDDGTLTDETWIVLQSHFPFAHLITRAQGDATANERLADFPRCKSFRGSNQLSQKLLDSTLFLQNDRMLLLDSDVLFFHSPQVLIERIENPDYRLNTFNSDFESAYTITTETARTDLCIDLHPCINSGLALVHRDSLRLDWIEEFLGVEELTSGHFWRIEQTLFALLSSRYGVQLLPDEYTLTLDSNAHEGRPFRHYVGAIRHLMYREGIPQLISDGFFGRMMDSNL